MPPAPKYRQIAKELHGQIESGALAPGQKLTETELKDQYGASRNTVRGAIQWLTGLGLVESKAGQGTFVAPKVDPFITVLTDGSKAPGRAGVEIEQQKKEPERTALEVSVEEASDKVATWLEIPEKSDVILRYETYSIGETPWSRQTSYYPGHFNDSGATQLIKPRDVPGGTVDYLAETLKLRQVRYTDLITVRAPDADEAEHFGVSEDGRVALFEIIRTAFDQHGKPMRLTITVCRTDRNQFAINVDTPPPAGP
jgi:GntR family transcriptional regulator